MGAQDGKKLPIHSVQFSIHHFLLLSIDYCKHPDCGKTPCESVKWESVRLNQ